MMVGEPVMARQIKRTDKIGLPAMLMLSVTAFAIVGVVGAAPLPDDLLGIQQQLIASKHKSEEIGMVQFVPPGGFLEGPPPGIMDRFGPPLPARGPGFPEGPPPQFAPRRACLEDINRQMGIYGYTKSKLQLSDGQKTAWKAVEDALDASMGKLRAVCETLPNDVVGPRGIIERSDFLENQLAARLDLIRALKAPMQLLIGQLTPDQRALLDAPPPFLRFDWNWP
jgi:hypothetical protein